jgi:3-hydroxyacyl-[acyl-carrier-protein] dehydratase
LTAQNRIIGRPVRRLIFELAGPVTIYQRWDAMSSGLDPETLEQTRLLIRRDLKLGAEAPLPVDMPFFGGDIDLDSLDLLLLVTSIERQFGVRIPNESVGGEVFRDVRSLVSYIQAHRDDSPAQAAAAVGAQGDWLARLPHGPEFRFVSSVAEVRLGEMARGTWTLTGREPFFAGHFPGNPIVPGVLIAEALAQISGLAGGTGGASQGKIAQIELRFEETATPPVDIELRANLVGKFGTMQKCDVVAQVGTKVLARGSITLQRGEAK